MWNMSDGHTTKWDQKKTLSKELQGVWMLCNGENLKHIVAFTGK